MRACTGLTIAAAIVAGCGDEDFKNEARAPIREALTGVIQDDKVTVSPSKIGAGPVEITISNQTKADHTVTLEGESIVERQGPVAPGDTLTIQKTPDPITQTREIRVINSGETKSVTFENIGQPQLGPTTPVRVEIAPVPGEARTTNNSATYRVVFSLPDG